jgi:hypothetical protein
VVLARHELERAEDVADTDFQATGACEETNAVDAVLGAVTAVKTRRCGTGLADLVDVSGRAVVILLDTNASTELDAGIRLSGCVDLQTETAGDEGFVDGVLVVPSPKRP